MYDKINIQIIYNIIITHTHIYIKECKELKPVLKEISPKYSLEGLMLKQKLQYFGYLMQRATD